MNKSGLMTLAGLAISLMMVIASLAATTEGSLVSGGSAGSTGSSGVYNASDQGMSFSDWDHEFGLAPEYRGEDFDAPSDQGMSSSDWDHEFGLAPEYRGEGFDASSDQDRDYGVYGVTPDKDLGAPY